EEYGGAILNRFGENLEQVSLFITVNEDILLLQCVEIFFNGADARGDVVIVSFRDIQKFHAAPPQFAYRVEDVVGGHSDVLYTRAFIEFQVFIDLRLPASLSRLVNREFDVSVAIGNHLRHQGAVLRADILIVKRDEQFESHDIFVEAYPLVHLSEFDVAYAVINVLEPYGRDGDCALARLVARQEWPVVVFPFDEGMERLAVGVDGSHYDFPEFVSQYFWFFRGKRAP